MRLRREFEDDLRLLDDLGWPEREPAQSFELTVPLDQLARTIGRLHDDASGALREYTSRDDEEQQIAARHALACSTYGTVLGLIAEMQ